MRMLTGYFSPTAGAACIAGHDVANGCYEAQSSVGYLPETPPLHPEMSVEAYLEFVARLRGASSTKAKASARTAMERCWLADRAGWVIDSLSRGYRQRVG